MFDFLDTSGKGRIPRDVAWIGLGAATLGLIFYIGHCVWVSAEMYSAPSIVLQTRDPSGGVHVFDDFREAYGWLRFNTDPNCKVPVSLLLAVSGLRAQAYSMSTCLVFPFVMWHLGLLAFVVSG